MTLRNFARFIQSNQEAVFFVLVLFAPLAFYILGFPEPVLQKDPGQYHDYAVHLAKGEGFSLDGVSFSNFREPLYPFFIAVLYLIFGIGNTDAVVFAQTLMLGLLGFLIYKSFALCKEKVAGYIAGIAAALLPMYGLYAHTYATELPFALTLAALLYVCLRIMFNQAHSWGWFAAVGLLLACGTLTRAQLLFFLPFIVLGTFLLPSLRYWHFVRGVVVVFSVFVLIVGSWLVSVHSQTGSFALTSGRHEISLYVRAKETQLSYATLTHYAIEWVRLSISGGTEGSSILEERATGMEWVHTATTTAAALEINNWTKNTILHNLPKYAYGNLIQLLRLLYIEHDYSDFLNRYLRAGMYAGLYLLFAIGLVGLWIYRRTTIAKLGMLAIVFIAYNILILTPFLTIPRYNTPYLFLFLVAGIAGIVPLIKKSPKPID